MARLLNMIYMYIYENIVVRNHDENMYIYIVDENMNWLIENVLWYIMNTGTYEVQATWCGIIYMYCYEKGELQFTMRKWKECWIVMIWLYICNLICWIVNATWGGMVEHELVWK